MNNPLVTLIEQLQQCRSREDYLAAMTQCRIGVQDIHAFCQYGDEGYQRNQIDVSDTHELVAICWRDGQDTPIHNHGDSQCCVRVLQGCIQEQRYERGHHPGDARAVGTPQQLTPLAETTFDSPDDFHRLTGLDASGSISLHLYVPPLHDCEILDATARDAHQAPRATVTTPAIR